METENKKSGSKWREVVRLVKEHMAANDLAVGSPIPSDRELASMACCSLQPVVRAMHHLASEGLITRHAGTATTVARLEPVIKGHEFSFAHSVHTSGGILINRLIEQTCRLPMISGNGEQDERKIQQELGLKRGEPFYVIRRLRLIDGEPRAIHRSYLNPNLLPSNFLVRHDFTSESLLDALTQSGCRAERRDLVLRARMPTEEERELLAAIPGEPLLEAQQELKGRVGKQGESVTLEVLWACYKNWEYRISDRRA